MSKRPTDHLEPSAKKRGNSRQLTKDDASDEDEVRATGAPPTRGATLLDASSCFRSRRLKENSAKQQRKS